MEFKDYYDALGVAEDADPVEIKRAYRRLARRYHPDVSRESDAESKFKEVNEAYEVLKDPEKRRTYDEIRRSPFDPGAFATHPGWQRGEGAFSTFSHTDASAFSDFFRSLFGEGDIEDIDPMRGPRYSTHGADIHDRIEVTLEEACLGGRRRIEIVQPKVGADGRLTRASRRLDVRIPRGVTDGRRIRLRGQGDPGTGDGPAGDVYLEVRIKEHPVYAVDGRDVVLSLPVAPWEAALGSTVEAPTLHGVVKLRIPAGSNSGSRLRLRGRGLPGSPPGDQIVVLDVQTPKPTTEDQRRLYRSLGAGFDFDPRRELNARVQSRQQEADDG